MKGGLGWRKNIGNDLHLLFNGNHFPSYLASEASPTLGCSIEISRDMFRTDAQLRPRYVTGFAGYVTGHPVVQPFR